MLIVEMMKIQARIKKKIKIFHKPTKQRSIILTFYDISLQIFFFICAYAFIGASQVALQCFLTWRIPGTEKPGGLPSMGSHRVRHN